MADVTPKKVKVVFGLRNVHYAVMSKDAEGIVTYTKPERLPGAVNLGLTQNGEIIEFYGDDIVYYGTSVNNGYDGTFEAADIPYEFKRDVLKEIEDKDNVQFEDAGAKPEHFALLAEFDTDQIAKRICMYDCICDRPGVSGATKTGSGTTPQTATLNIKSRPVEIAGKKIVKSATTPATSTEAYSSWFTAVHMFNETASGL